MPEASQVVSLPLLAADAELKCPGLSSSEKADDALVTRSALAGVTGSVMPEASIVVSLLLFAADARLNCLGLAPSVKVDFALVARCAIAGVN